MYKDAMKRKRFKSKQEGEIMKIYETRKKYIEEGNTPIMAALKGKKKEEMKASKKEKQGIKVSAWKNPQEQLALAMLRNFILLLEYKPPDEEKNQRKYQREISWQKEIIYKEIEKMKHKMDV
jgi:hypothetical protein